MKKSDFWVGRLKPYIGNLNKDFQYLHKCMIVVTLLALQIHKNGIEQKVSMGFHSEASRFAASELCFDLMSYLSS